MWSDKNEEETFQQPENTTPNIEEDTQEGMMCSWDYIYLKKNALAAQPWSSLSMPASLFLSGYVRGSILFHVTNPGVPTQQSPRGRKYHPNLTFANVRPQAVFWADYWDNFATDTRQATG